MTSLPYPRLIELLQSSASCQLGVLIQALRNSEDSNRDAISRIEGYRDQLIAGIGAWRDLDVPPEATSYPLLGRLFEDCGTAIAKAVWTCIKEVVPHPFPGPQRDAAVEKCGDKIKEAHEKCGDGIEAGAQKVGGGWGDDGIEIGDKA